MRMLLFLSITLGSSCFCLGQGAIDFAKIETDVDRMLRHLNRISALDDKDSLIAANADLCGWLSDYHAESHPPKKKRCWTRKIRIEAEASLINDLQYLCFLFNLNDIPEVSSPPTIDIKVPDGGSQGDSILGFRSFLRFQLKKFEYDTILNQSLVKLLITDREARYHGVLLFFLKEIKVKLALYRQKKYRLSVSK